MLKDIVQVTPVGDYRLRLRFEDGVEGVVDIARLVGFDGVFAALRDLTKFQQVRVNEELGTIVWPNGADLDASVLYAHITDQTLATGTR
ncbi:MAG: DUF2442 domain-containing protein [Phycisphaeraceae bacterium]